jgi:hypothetical protein
LTARTYGRVLGFRKHPTAHPAFKRYGTYRSLRARPTWTNSKEKTRRILEIDINASDIHALGMPPSALSGRDYTEKLIVF